MRLRKISYEITDGIPPCRDIVDSIVYTYNASNKIIREKIFFNANTNDFLQSDYLRNTNNRIYRSILIEAGPQGPTIIDTFYYSIAPNGHYFLADNNGNNRYIYTGDRITAKTNTNGTDTITKYIYDAFSNLTNEINYSGLPNSFTTIYDTKTNPLKLGDDGFFMESGLEYLGNNNPTSMLINDVNCSMPNPTDIKRTCNIQYTYNANNMPLTATCTINDLNGNYCRTELWRYFYE